MQAYLHNYTYPCYAWMMYDWYLDGWWTSAMAGDDAIDCKDHELAGFWTRHLQYSYWMLLMKRQILEL